MVKAEIRNTGGVRTWGVFMSTIYVTILVFHTISEIRKFSHRNAKNERQGQFEV